MPLSARLASGVAIYLLLLLHEISNQLKYCTDICKSGKALTMDKATEHFGGNLAEEVISNIWPNIYFLLYAPCYQNT